MDRTLYLVGCGKTKLDTAAPAQDLYTGNLFKARRRYVECQPGLSRWFILSAMHGLVEPTDVLEPYDLRLDQLTARERVAWGEQVWEELVQCVSLRDVDVIEVHAGAAYVDALLFCRASTPHFYSLIHHPTAGMGIGVQLGWYAHRSPKQLSLLRAGGVL